MYSRWSWLLVVLFALVGCSGGARRADAERAVEEFHQRLDRGSFAIMYADTHPDLKAATSEKDFVAFLDAVHRKLGTIRKTEQLSWRVGSFNLNTEVSLTYKTTFDSGEGMESFSFRFDGGRAMVRGYNINSKELVLK